MILHACLSCVFILFSLVALYNQRIDQDRAIVYIGHMSVLVNTLKRGGVLYTGFANI